MIYVTNLTLTSIIKCFFILYFLLTLTIFVILFSNDRKVLISHKNRTDLPVIYVVTPTYERHVQKALIIHLLHTFLHVPNLHWIVIEDSAFKTEQVKKFLENSELSYTHLNVPTPELTKLQNGEARWRKPRGVLQRNEGLLWLRNNKIRNGVVYFADDDNTYDLKLFEEMRFTQKVSVWPVGLVGHLLYEKPKLLNGKVVGWRTAWKRWRTFATDMAGFAFNALLLLQNPEARFSIDSKVGEQENDFLLALGVQLKDLEPRSRNCTEILVWHTRFETPNLKNEEKLNKLDEIQTDVVT